MKSTKIELLFWLCIAAPSLAQPSYQIDNPMVPAVQSAARATSIEMTRPAYFVNKRPQAVVETPFSQDDATPTPGYFAAEYPGMEPNVDRLSFNATQPRSKILINPDQFWTRKSRPIIDSRNHHLFGDPACACDEWAGFCNCCGFKANPGHLGQRWLRGDDPCECFDNSCSSKSCRRCRPDQYSQCP